MTQPSADLDPVIPAPTDDVLRAWWAALPGAVRRQLLHLPAGEPLPRSTATELLGRGVACPLTLVEEHGRTVRRALPPRALLELMAREAPAEPV